jgi:subtilase family serine protease
MKAFNLLYASLSLKRVPNRSVSTAIVLGIAAISFSGQTRTLPLKNSVVGSTSLGSVVGTVDDNEELQVAVVLNINETALQKFVDQVSNPSSPMYRQFLTPAQVGAQFGASPADVAATVAFLKENGLTVTSVAPQNNVIIVKGTAGQISRTFQTSLVNVQRTEDGTMFHTNTKPVLLPAALSSKVQTVYGLDTSRRMKKRATTTQLYPTLYRPAYNGAKAYTGGYYGKGVNVAVANWDGFRLNNLPYVYGTWGLPVPTGGVGANVTVKVVKGGTGYGSGTPGGEGDLDQQNVLASAPLCNLYVYDDNTSDSGAPLTTYTQIATDNLADIVTESYGWESYSYTYNRSTKKGTAAYYGAASTADHNEHLILSAQGITYMAATGDSGTASLNHVTTGTKSVNAYDYPDMDPEVLQVGGTEVTVDSTTGARVSEVPWGLSAGTGGTGGFDFYDSPANGFAFNVAPSYQKSYIPTFTSKYNYRLFPDISSHAGGQDGLGSSTTSAGWAYVIFFNEGNKTYPLGSAIVIDGTSCASPAVAGSLAVVEQRLFLNTTPNAGRTNVRLGRIQDLLYKLASTPTSYASVFYDITTGTNVGTIPGFTPAVVTTPGVGWDFSTGWGSVNFEGLYQSFFTGKKP